MLEIYYHNHNQSIVSLLSVEHVKRTVPFSVEPSFPDAVDASNDGFIWIGSRGEGARWLSGSNHKASSSIRRLRRWAGDVEVESEEAEVEAELEVVVDGIRRSRGVNVKLAASRSRRHRWLAASRLRSRRRHRRRSSRSAPSYHRRVSVGLRRRHGRRFKIGEEREEEDDEPERERGK